MKRNLFLLPFLLAVLCVAAAAQNQTRSRRVTGAEANQKTSSSSVPSAVSSPEKPANHFAKRTPANDQASTTNPGSLGPTEKDSGTGNAVWGNAPVDNSRATDRTLRSRPLESSAAAGTSPKKLIERTTLVVEAPTGRATMPASNTVASTGVVRPTTAARRPVSPTEEYLVGVGDVLDIRVLEMPTRESTLFTVLTNGSIDYPLLNAPVKVTGLTTAEIANRLRGEIKVIENAQLSVNVRDFASHAVMVTGWVDNPGRKMLRRESMPLYTVLAEALPRAEASIATIVRNQRAGQPLDLNDQKAMSTLLLPGDVVRISGKEAAPKQFVYVAGQVISPGEKDFRVGMTLTQVILAAGGTARDAGKSVKVSRRNPGGFLVASEFDLRSIQESRSPDPLIQAGDRIEVGRALW